MKKLWKAVLIAAALSLFGGGAVLVATSAPSAADAFLPLGTPYTHNPDCTYSRIQVGSQWMRLEQCNTN